MVGLAASNKARIPSTNTEGNASNFTCNSMGYSSEFVLTKSMTSSIFAKASAVTVSAPP
jgi:hypothetical protein